MAESVVSRLAGPAAVAALIAAVAALIAVVWVVGSSFEVAFSLSPVFGYQLLNVAF